MDMAQKIKIIREQHKFQLLTKYSHLIFQMTSTLTTISANKRARPTNQVFDGSNNNVFIHSIEKCKSKSFHFGLALFLRTAILSLDLSRLLVRQLFDTLLDCHWLYYTFGLHEDFRSLSEAPRDSRINAQHGEICAAVLDNHSHFRRFIP